MSDYLILNAGEGYRTKSYGPKCLFKLEDGRTILKYQTDQIEAAGGSVNIVGGFEHHKIKKQSSSPMYVCDDYNNHNQVFSIVKACDELDIFSCFVISGDLVFDKLPKIEPGVSTVYWSKNKRPLDVGLTYDDKNYLSYIMWGLEPSWAEITYLDSEIIEFFADNLKHLKRSFLLEGLNMAVDAGIDIKCAPLNGSIFDVDQKSDTVPASELLKGNL